LVDVTPRVLITQDSFHKFNGNAKGTTDDSTVATELETTNVANEELGHAKPPLCFVTSGEVDSSNSTEADGSNSESSISSVEVDSAASSADVDGANSSAEVDGLGIKRMWAESTETSQCDTGQGLENGDCSPAGKRARKDATGGSDDLSDIAIMEPPTPRRRERFFAAMQDCWVTKGIRKATTLAISVAKVPSGAISAGKACPLRRHNEGTVKLDDEEGRVEVDDASQQHPVDDPVRNFPEDVPFHSADEEQAPSEALTPRKASIYARHEEDQMLARNQLTKSNDEKQQAEETLARLKTTSMAKRAHQNHFLPLTQGKDGVEEHLEALDGLLSSLGCDVCLLGAFKAVYQRKSGGKCGMWCMMTVDDVGNFLLSPECGGSTSTSLEKLDEDIASATQRLLDCVESVRLAKINLRRSEEDMNFALEDLRVARLAEREAKEALLIGQDESEDLSGDQE